MVKKKRKKSSERLGVPRSLSNIRGETPSRSPGYVKPPPRGKMDAERLTPKQRQWVELLCDFRNTMYECARIAGYGNPERSVREMYKNPSVVRAILRRYHRRMLQLAKAFGPQLKFVHKVPRPPKGVHLRTGQGNAQEGMRIPVAEGVLINSILGEGK